MSALREASKCFHAGNLAASEKICRQILDNTPRNSEALCLMGLTRHQAGDHHRACDFMEQAISADPVNDVAHFNYGVILLQLNKTDEALEAFQKALRFKFDNPEIHFNVGNVLFQQGHSAEAIEYYRQAIMLNPDYGDAFFNLGLAYKNIQDYDQASIAFQNALRQDPNNSDTLFNLALILHVQGHIELAIIVYQKTLEINPNHHAVYTNLGIALREQGRHHEAIKVASQALSVQPEDAMSLNTLGLSLQETGQIEKALDAFRKAIQCQPDFAQAYSNLGNILQGKERYSEAIDVYERALDISPTFYECWYNLGKCYSLLNDLLNSIKMYRQAISLQPDLAQAHWNLSHVLLLSGEYTEGFQEYLWRWRRKGAVITNIPKPEWQGELLPESTLLVHTEQGLGDSIQFARYLPLAKKRANKLILACEASLTRLFTNYDCIDKIIRKSEIASEIENIDCHVPLLNLPTIFETTLDTIPDSAPNISPDPDLVEKYKGIFNTLGDEFKVGLVWKGNPNHSEDSNRSCHIDDFLPLFELPGTAFFSLQKQDTGIAADFNVVNLAPYLNSFADTAALVSYMDLIISVDTSVLHLAGAMGKSAWALLPFVPDWRWMLDREDTPWYPTMRLFRQQQRKNWQHVVEKARQELHKTIQEKGTTF